jgi:mannitol/fructose-specific phosphotransferase system IIA component (Ntr-type)
MKTLLDALQEGRLIELPDNHKNRALEYLAALIEAIPDIGLEEGITESVLAREAQYNTGIGDGWACPHARTRHDGEVVCAVGWSPGGIDYGAPDGQPVHLLVMYFVPESQKNSYLKEISSLAKAIKTQPSLRDLKALDDLGQVRHALLDAITLALESAAPEAKARMIQLEAKHAEARDQAHDQLQDLLSSLPGGELPLRLTPLSIVIVPGLRPIVLCQDGELAGTLEFHDQLAQQLAAQARAEHQGTHVLVRSSAAYQPDRVVYDCLAFRAKKAGSS